MASWDAGGAHVCWPDCRNVSSHCRDCAGHISRRLYRRVAHGDQCATMVTQQGTRLGIHLLTISTSAALIALVLRIAGVPAHTLHKLERLEWTAILLEMTGLLTFLRGPGAPHAH